MIKFPTLIAVFGLFVAILTGQVSAQSGNGCADRVMFGYEQALNIAIAASSNADACLSAVDNMQAVMSQDSSISSVCQMARTMAMEVRQLKECAPGNFSSELILPVIAGGREDEGESCGTFGVIENAGSGGAKLKGGPGNSYPVRLEIAVGTEVFLCGTDKSGDWESIILATDDECLVGYEGPKRTPYQGHCMSGWVPVKAVRVTAG